MSERNEQQHKSAIIISVVVKCDRKLVYCTVVTESEQIDKYMHNQEREELNVCAMAFQLEHFTHSNIQLSHSIVSTL